MITALTDAPYLYYWSNVAAGNYALTAKAIDNLGGTTQSAPGRATPPASITLSATAADADGTIAKVEFFQGSTLLASVTALSTCWDVKAAVGKPNPNGRDEVTIKRRLLNIFYTGDLIPE